MVTLRNLRIGGSDGSSESGRGVENSGGWKAYRKFGEKPLPKNVFGPPTYDTFSPPPLFWQLSVISLKRKRHDQPQFLRPPEVVLESTLCSTFPPPQIHAIRFPPPLSCCPSSHQLSGVTSLRARQKGDSKREKPDLERKFSQIFCRFSLRSGNQEIWESQICAENRRKPQICAGNHRKPQIFAETGFSHLLSPFPKGPCRTKNTMT